MIPTFLGTTLLVFTILQIAPDGPFERAVKQLKNPGNNKGEVSNASGSKVGNSNELSPDVLEKLKAQYGLDKPIPARYLVWLGLYPRETHNQEIIFQTDYTGKVTTYNEYFPTIIDELNVSDAEKLYLQKYINIRKENNKFVISESGAGLDEQLKSDDYFNNKNDTSEVDIFDLF